jgi:hypothetical protein
VDESGRRFPLRADRAFNVRATSVFTPDRVYRVYACGNQLAFIKIGGQSGVAEGVAAGFGLLGGLFLAWWKKRSGIKLQQRLAQEDQQDIELLLTRDPKNFVMLPVQVRSAAIEPPARLGAHGRHCGIWRLEETNGKKHTFQFEEVSAMHEAIAVLPPMLGSALTVNVRWDERKGAYTRSETPSRAA